MQVFELHFNPKLKEDQIFDSFVYEPENIYEKNLGSLYVIGELRNALRFFVDSVFITERRQIPETFEPSPLVKREEGKISFIFFPSIFS
ncbi:unnamed protein product, partial [marine sediment metagenome]